MEKTIQERLEELEEKVEALKKREVYRGLY
jgi:tetrahydromethanopterin S-methyltransferase subunit G